MWPLRYFESNSIWIPEIDNEATLDGILAWLIAVACVVALYLLKEKIGLKRPSKYGLLAIVIPLAFFVMLAFFYLPYLNLSLLIIGLMSNVYILMFIFALIEGKERRTRIRYYAAYWGIYIIMIVSVIYYVCSYAYFLPASYPAREREILRNLRRIIEVEWSSARNDHKLLQLAELHLRFEGKDLIDDELRSGVKDGYQYKLYLNKPKEGLFYGEALPLEYQKGDYSFHVFPVNPEEDPFEGFMVYCISMADKGGQPATPRDRHFHRRSLFQLIAQQLP